MGHWSKLMASLPSDPSGTRPGLHSHLRDEEVEKWGQRDKEVRKLCGYGGAGWVGLGQAVVAQPYLELGLC